MIYLPDIYCNLESFELNLQKTPNYSVPLTGYGKCIMNYYMALITHLGKARKDAGGRYRATIYKFEDGTEIKPFLFRFSLFTWLKRIH